MCALPGLRKLIILYHLHLLVHLEILECKEVR